MKGFTIIRTPIKIFFTVGVVPFFICCKVSHHAVEGDITTFLSAEITDVVKIGDDVVVQVKITNETNYGIKTFQLSKVYQSDSSHSLNISGYLYMPQHENEMVELKSNESKVVSYKYNLGADSWREKSNIQEAIMYLSFARISVDNKDVEFANEKESTIVAQKGSVKMKGENLR